jgi:RNA polymerase sigma-70 factor (ECF subfamily)
VETERFFPLFLQHRRMLFGFIISIVRDRDAAEDVFQEVSAAGIERCGVFEEGTDFGAWLREIARRRILKARESRGPRLVALDEEAIDAIAAVHSRLDIAGWADRQDALRACMERLARHSRDLVTLRYRESLGFDDIAQRLRSSSNSVQVMLSKIRKTLHRCIEQRLAAEDAP